MIDPVVSVSLRCVLALVFATAAWHKASSSSRFTATLKAYRLLPSSVESIVAKALPFAEAAVAIALLLPVYRGAALGAVALLVIYSVGIAVNLARGRHEIDCGCFGPAERVPLSGSLVLRNAMLIAMSVVILLPVASRELVWVDGLTIVAAVTAMTALWSSQWRLRQIAATAQKRGGGP